MQIPLSRRRFIHLSGTAAALTLSPLPANAAPVTLRVGYIPIIPMTQLFIMEGEGWTGRAGLKLQLTQFSSGPTMVQALASGSLDVAYVGIGPAIVARSRGIDIKVLASNIIDQVALIGRGPFAETMATAPSAAEGFRRYYERAGRPVKIATLPQGSVPDTVLRYYIQNVAKVDPAHVQIIGIGEDQVQQSLLAGAVEGASILEPILTIVQERDPTARIIATPNAMLPRQPGAVLAVRETAIADHPRRNRETGGIACPRHRLRQSGTRPCGRTRHRVRRQGLGGPRSDKQGSQVPEHQSGCRSSCHHGIHGPSSGFPAGHGCPGQAGQPE